MTNAWTRISPDALAIFEERVLLSFIVLSAIATVVVGFSFKDSGMRLGAAGNRRSRVCYCPVFRAAQVFLEFVLAAFLALHIQLARGVEEMRGGVLVSSAN